MAINQSTLRSKAAEYSLIKEATINFSSGIRRTAFLCHSHKDVELVKGLLVLFKEQGLDIYIDWRDHSMPETPNAETARKIQEKIKNSDLFLFLATANSKASRWCPWEIGYADSSQKGIYIIPTKDGVGIYGNEYLELYSRIDSGTDNVSGRSAYRVFKPESETGSAVSNSTIR